MTAPRDLTGRRFGGLTVLHPDTPYVRPSGYRDPRWVCLCDCGATAAVSASNLIRGNSKTCGCAQRATILTNNLHRVERLRSGVDMVGRVFGLLTVVSCSWVEDPKRGYLLCQCLCDGCERVVQIRKRNLMVKNGTKSCGCAKQGMRAGALAVRPPKWPVSPVGVPASKVSQRIHAGWSVDRALNTPVDRRKSLAGKRRISNCYDSELRSDREAS